MGLFVWIYGEYVYQYLLYICNICYIIRMYGYGARGFDMWCMCVKYALYICNI